MYEQRAVRSGLSYAVILLVDTKTRIPTPGAVVRGNYCKFRPVLVLASCMVHSYGYYDNDLQYFPLFLLTVSDSRSPVMSFT
jgi:hypothetical protein